MDRREVNFRLPQALCSNLNVPCGKRTKNHACRITACGYNVQTTGLQLQEKKLLLAYSRT